MVSVYGAAQAAGATGLEDARTAEEIIQVLTVGVHGSGTSEGSAFKISNMDAKLQQDVISYLTFLSETGELTYHPRKQAAPATPAAM